MPVFAGSKVLMADGSRKNVEDISYGDYVKDFQGNPAMVDGVRCHPIVDREYYLINENLLIPNSTILGTEGNKFNYVGSIWNALDKAYEKPLRFICKVFLPYIEKNNHVVAKWTWIEESYNITELQVGQKLIKDDGTLETVNSIRQITKEEAISISSHRSNFDTLYNFSIEKCAVWIDGYLTGGRLSESWDYNTFSNIEGKVTVTLRGDGRHTWFAKRTANIDWSTEEDLIYWNENTGAWDDSWKMKQ
jgi:hypothetical protein